MSIFRRPAATPLPAINAQSPDLSVTGQIQPEHIPALAAAGFKTLICNRPDGEEPGQPTFQAIAEAAAASGLKAVLIPVSSGRISEQDAQHMLTAVTTLPKPALAYCRSGARSAMLWRLAEAL